MTIDKKFSAKELTKLLLENNINNYELSGDKNEVNVEYIKDFNRLIPKLKVHAYRGDLGEFAPYGVNMNVWFKYKGWTFNSNMLSKKSKKK